MWRPRLQVMISSPIMHRRWAWTRYVSLLSDLATLPGRPRTLLPGGPVIHDRLPRVGPVFSLPLPGTGKTSEATPWTRLVAPTDALPVDLFRIGMGLVSAAYFGRLAVEARRLYGERGLLDPVLTRELFWYARWTPLHPALPGIGVTFFRVLYLGAAGASLVVAAGCWPRPLSAGLFVVAASTFRWNIPAVYLDDALVHLMLLWLALLPTGNSLTLPHVLRRDPAMLACWRATQVPGLPVRCFVANLALMYGVAGAWKWSSPLWRQGLALYAGLKMAVAHDPDRWQVHHLGWLRAGNYGALLLESMTPVAFVLPAFHPVRLLVGSGLVAFHLGIVSTLKIPFANLACIAALAVVFRAEVMSWLGRGEPGQPAAVVPPVPLDLRAGVPIALVSTIAMAMVVDALRPRWRSGTHDSVRTSAAARSILRAGHNPFTALLWLGGVAQSYRLFDWIDERNYHITYDVSGPGANGQAGCDRILFPRSQRDVLLQSYLHDVMWLKLPRHRLAEFQASLFERYACQYCARHRGSGPVEVARVVQRVHAANLDLHQPVREPFLAFSCRGDQPVIRFMRLTRE